MVKQVVKWVASDGSEFLFEHEAAAYEQTGMLVREVEGFLDSNFGDYDGFIKATAEEVAKALVQKYNIKVS